MVFDAELKTEIKLETKITKELAEEGAARELARQIQEMRKVAGLTRKNFIAVHHENAGPKAENFLKKWGAYLKKENLAREILPHDKDVNYLAQKTFDLAGEKIKIAIRKVK